MVKKRNSAALKIIEGGRDGKLSLVHEDASEFEVLFENAIDAIFVVELQGLKIERANQSFLELTGYLKDEIEFSNLDKVFPDHLQVFENPGFHEDVVLIRKDGYPRYVSVSVRAVKVNNKSLGFCILRDVTDKKQMERDLITKHTELREAYIQLEKANAELKTMQETLVQSGKLAALGELAAGIAHELNQPLTAVKGFAQEATTVLKECLPNKSADQALSYLQEVVQGAGKMEKIISHLRNFTRKSTEDFKMTNLHQVIEESLLMLDKQFRSRGIRVNKKFQNDLPEIFCNPFQLEQVFINLSTNARDAIEARNKESAMSGGSITIETKTLPNNIVMVTFEDDGAGIPESVRQKIFNPFFTTKEVGKGMGLGLSISYGILSRIHASIVVESASGKGTKFIMKLPIDYRKH